MRRLLLATAATIVVSATAASQVDAQVVADDSSSNLGTVSSPSNFASTGVLNSSNDGQSYPTPGTVTVRLNGRFRFYAAVLDSGAARTNVSTTTSSSASTSSSGVATNTPSAGINKSSNYGFYDYIRLYPGFDGVAANGLKYGASIEIREDGNFGAGGGVYGSPSAESQNSGKIYVRREWGYLGTDKFGTLRLGAADQPSSLYLTGTFENFDDGGLNGDLPFFLPSSQQLSFPFADQGSLYATIKAVYLSPQFYGFDGGVSFEPSTAVEGGDSGGCSPTAGNGQFTSAGSGGASAGCDNLSSTSTNDVGRRKDTYEALLRYRGTFGPIGLAATGSYTGSGRVADSGITGSTLYPKHFRLEDLSVFDTGWVVTYGGLSFGGNYQRGRYNNQSAGLSSGFGGLIAKGQRDSSAYIVGASYTIGPIIFGAHYLRENYEGDQQTATNFTTLNVAAGGTAGGQRFEEGVGYGLTYSLAPGVALYYSGVWTERRQNGYNFITGTSNNPNNNKVSASVNAIGTSFAW